MRASLVALFVLAGCSGANQHAVEPAPAPEAVEPAAPESVESAAPEPKETAAPEPAESAAPEPAESAAAEPAETAAAEPAETAAAEPAESAAPAADSAPDPVEAEPAVSEEEAVASFLDELAALGEAVVASDPDAGGSIRAKREPPMDGIPPSKKRLRARVEGVQRGRFPVAAVRVRILRPPKDGPGSDLKKNKRIVVMPRLAVGEGRVLMHEATTVQNAGVYYLRRGDRVHVLLDERQPSGAWWAEAIARE